MSKTKTLYGEVDASLFDKMAGIELVAFDVDGIFSDGRIYLGNQGEELKCFHTLDGYGIKALINVGIEVAVITGRNSSLVEQRMQALGVQHIVQGQVGKMTALRKLQHELAVEETATLSMGDDMPDLGMFDVSAITASVPNGHPAVTRKADYVTQREGGYGAVREVADLILQAKGKLDFIYGSSV